jgi:hypothetical protein
MTARPHAFLPHNPSRTPSSAGRCGRVLALLAAVCLLAPVAACRPSAAAEDIKPADQGAAQPAATATGFSPFGSLSAQDLARAEASQIQSIVKVTVGTGVGWGLAPWQDEGGTASIEVLNGVMVMTQTPEGHRKVSEFLRLLHEAGAIKFDATDALPKETALQTRTRDQLAKKIDVAFAKTPLIDALKVVSEKTGLNFAIDPDIAANGFDLSTRHADLKGKPQSAECVLDQILQEEFGYTVEDGFVLVTTRHRQWQRLTVGLYRVWTKDGRPLGVAKDSPFDPNEIKDLLYRIVNQAVSPGVAGWQDEGGPAALCFYNDTLAVTQSPRGQQQIESILRRLAEKGVLGAGSGEAFPAKADPPEAAALRRTLDEPVDVEFTNMSISDVFKRLNQLKPALAIQADPAIARDGIDLDARRVDLQIKQAPVGAILDLVLDHELTYKFTPEGLLITTRERVTARDLPMVVYRLKGPSVPAANKL